MSLYGTTSLLDEFGDNQTPKRPASPPSRGWSPLLRQAIGLSAIILLAGLAFLASRLTTEDARKAGARSVSLDGQCDGKVETCYAAAAGITGQPFYEWLTELESGRNAVMDDFGLNPSDTPTEDVGGH